MDQKQQPVPSPRISIEQIEALTASMRPLREAFESLVEVIATTWHPGLRRLAELMPRDDDDTRSGT